MMDNGKEYEEMIDAELKEWHAKIERLRTKADKLKAEVKGVYLNASSGFK